MQAREKTEQQWKDKDFEEFKKDESLRLESLGAANGAAAAMEGEAEPMMDM